MRKILAVALSTAIAVTGIAPSFAEAAPLRSVPTASTVSDDMITEVRSRHRHYRDRHYYRGRGIDPGAAAAAGVIGLAAGVIAGQALAAPRGPAYPAYGDAYVDPDWLDYCYARYRSFDPHTGTYMGYDGRRYRCRRPGID